MVPSPSRDSVRRSFRWAAALVVWIAFVWGHSLIQGPQSSAESGLVVSILAPAFRAVGVTDADAMSFLVRKCAHFSEYAVLGVLARGFFSARAAETGRPALPSGLAVALVPVVDECLQLFVPGRSGQPSDVLIDLAGFLAGVLVSHAAARLLRARRAS